MLTYNTFGRIALCILEYITERDPHHHKRASHAAVADRGDIPGPWYSRRPRPPISLWEAGRWDLTGWPG